MSLYVGTTASDYGVRSSSVINHNSAYTWMAWADLVTDTDTYGHVWAAMSATYDEWYDADWLGTGSDGVSATVGCAVGGSTAAASGSPMTVGTPVHLALVRESASVLKLYQGGSYANQASMDISARPATQREMLGLLNDSGGYRGPFRLTAIKCWQAALTADEIAAEMKSIRPLRLANLHSWHPCIANNLTDALKDYSGNGRDWSAQGTLTVESQTPPVSWGASPIIVLSVTVITQKLAPVSDVSAGSWTPSSGSDLYAMLDETAASDADYIQATSATTCTLALASGSDPSSSTGHILRYRLLAGSGQVTATLKQGTTTIASFGPHTLTGAAQDFAQTLSAGQADSITDYSALRVEFTAALP